MDYYWTQYNAKHNSINTNPLCTICPGGKQAALFIDCCWTAKLHVHNNKTGHNSDPEWYPIHYWNTKVRYITYL